MSQIFATIWFFNESSEQDWKSAFVADNKDQIIENVLEEIKNEGVAVDKISMGVVYHCKIVNEDQLQSLYAYSEALDMTVTDISGRVVKVDLAAVYGEEYQKHIGTLERVFTQ